MSFCKQKFDDAYNHPDPTAYLRRLGKLKYRETDFVHGPLVEKIASISNIKNSCTVLDIACSYGFNGCIAKFKLPFGDSIFSSPSRSDRKCKVIGLDISINALKYAKRHYFIDEYIHQNLELNDMTESQKSLACSADLVIASGAFSYIGINTLKKIFRVTSAATDFIGWPACSYDKTQLLAFLNNNFKTVSVSKKSFPMREFDNSFEKESYISAVARFNPDTLEKNSQAICVLQISATGRK